MPLSEQYTMEKMLNLATGVAMSFKHKYLTPEHMLLTLIDCQPFEKTLRRYGDPYTLAVKLKIHLSSSMFDTVQQEVIDEGKYVLSYSFQFELLEDLAVRSTTTGKRSEVGLSHWAYALFMLNESWAAHQLMEFINGQPNEFLEQLYDECDRQAGNDTADFPQGELGEEEHVNWRDYVVNINALVDEHLPIIGREAELDRTIEVLCRMEKNNVLYLGEPGVGKTAMAYGLARRLVNGDVPQRLKDAIVYSLELSSLLAGTQYRGVFEKRLKTVMDDMSQESNIIVFIDEIHTIVGAGQVGESTLDASDLLKPYLEGGRLRFIGATTYSEHKQHMANSQTFLRRFQVIDINEPSVEQTFDIVNQLKDRFEQFHQVAYDDEALKLAVTGSVHHIKNRFLPDKAIDLIDEAGAHAERVQADGATSRVDEELMAEVLARVAKVDLLSMKESDQDRLMSLEPRIKSLVFGQDAAVANVVEAVQMAKAGLTLPGKPLASLLFVGPTGVGKTEVARVLAQQLGVELVRFDMSEYVEKHTVAKLIGSPAGYVGYDDGGLLTEAVRRHPDCVLLLDEIEKAHSDIYNILLQVMDYGTLTDNKGQKAHFGNVVVIMTSNAGARYAHQASVGFASTATAGSAMLAQVKRTFNPEFINRLSAIVVFNEMSHEMADAVLGKKLAELDTLLAGKNVKVEITPEAREWLLEQGYSARYGAREMDRVITAQLKTLLMREILFGRLADGGTARVALDGDRLTLSD